MPEFIYKLSLIQCRQCQHDRHDDGLRCERCGSYENRNITYHGEALGWRDKRYEDVRFIADNVVVSIRRGDVQ